MKVGNSNTSTLSALRHLSKATATLAKISERLGTGQRINRAADDPAGLAIASALTAKRRIYGQGIKNLNDGLSYIAVASGAMQELKAILLRQRELAAQASNGSYSDNQRRALDAELQQLTSEWNRIADSTTFNGRTVFNSDEGDLRLQAGIGAEATIDVPIGIATAGTDGFSPSEETLRVSAGVSGAEANGNTNLPASFSADGRYVAYVSSASNLVAGDNNVFADVFVTDLQTGTTIKVTESTAGGDSNGHAWDVSLSADGRYVTYSSDASNLVTSDTNGSTDVFLTDLQTGTTIKVTESTIGGATNGGSTAPKISADGRYITYSSTASNLVVGDGNGFNDVFVTDLQTGTTIKVSENTVGGDANGNSLSPVISSDGRYVAYVSNATNIVGGDTNVQDVFLADLQAGTTIKVTKDTGGGIANGISSAPVISADGRYVAYDSAASDLVAVDTNGAGDIFVFDRQTDTNYKITQSTSGGAADGSSNRASISDDGRYVAYYSFASNLTSSDPNPLMDVFVTDRQSGTTRLISKDTAGGGINAHAQGAVISPDGSSVSFYSAASDLVTGDSGTYTDSFVIANPLFEQTVALGLSLSLDSFSIATREQALSAQTTIDNELTELSSIQGSLGATEARVIGALGNLLTVRENFGAAESRITDADMADEAARSVSGRIAQDIAAAVLAQANQSWSLVLTLLR